MCSRYDTINMTTPHCLAGGAKLWTKQHGTVELAVRYYRHHRLYSPRWALASSKNCRQPLLSWAAINQFLQPSFFVSSSTPSLHLDFGRPRPRWPPEFVHNTFIRNSLSSIRATWPAHLNLLYYTYYVSYIWFIVESSSFNCIRFIAHIFWFSVVSLPPLPFLAYWTIYSAKDFRLEDIQVFFHYFLSQSRILRRVRIMASQVFCT